MPRVVLAVQPSDATRGATMHMVSAAYAPRQLTKLVWAGIPRESKLCYLVMRRDSTPFNFP